MTDEQWRDVPGFGGHYQASTWGRIRTKARIVKKRHQSGCLSIQRYSERVLSPTSNKGYLAVHIGFDGKRQTVRVHHMVLLAFAGPRPEGAVGCHNDDNPGNNSPANLRWDTHTGNMADRKRAGRYATGDAHPMAKFSEGLRRAVPSMTRAEARLHGISGTHYYRLRDRRA